MSSIHENESLHSSLSLIWSETARIMQEAYPALQENRLNVPGMEYEFLLASLEQQVLSATRQT
jgi:hypothetical protein